MSERSELEEKVMTGISKGEGVRAPSTDLGRTVVIRSEVRRDGISRQKTLLRCLTEAVRSFSTRSPRREFRGLDGACG